MPELLGYEVRKLEKGREVAPGFQMEAYQLFDKNGAKYVLWRNKPNPHLLFAVHARKFGCATIKGYKWFTDKDGELKPVR